jgi:non-specific serine/threonine protein kinase
MLESGEIELGLRFAWVMWRFWWVRGYLSEGRRRTADLLSLARPAGPGALLARGLVGAGLLAMWQADYPAATSHLEEALTMARRSGDQHATAYALAFLNRVRRDQGDEDNARVLGTEAVELFRRLDDRWGLAMGLHFLGLACEAADTSVARQLFEESASVFGALGDAWDRAMPLRGLGDVAYLEGDAARAERLYLQSADLFQQRGDDWSVAMLRTQLGYAALAQRNASGAARLFTQSLDRWHTLGHRRGTVLCLTGLAAIVVDRGHLVEAARLLGATEAACERNAIALEPIARATYDVRVQRVRRQLGEASFASAWGEGRELDLDDALAMALAASGTHSGQPSRDLLSVRERDVARLIAAGLTNRQVGEQLVISERTVDRHVENIFKKLGCATRSQIAAWATEMMGTASAPSSG